MKIKDSTIICFLIGTIILVLCGVLGAESEIDRLQAQLDQLQGDFEDMSSEVSAELAEHEDRLYLIEHHQDVVDIRVSNHYKKFLELQEQVAEHNDKITKIEKQSNGTASKKLNLKISQSNIRKIGSLVYLECGSCSVRCKRAVASVIFNRMIRYHKTVNQVIYERGVFSVANGVSRTTPSQSCIDAVKYVLYNGTTVPRRVTAFRNRRYHRFGKPYCAIDGVYFTYV